MLYECGCCKGVMKLDCSSRATGYDSLICLRCEQQFQEELSSSRGDEMYAAAYHRHVTAAAATAVMSEVIGHC